MNRTGIALAALFIPTGLLPGREGDATPRVDADRETEVAQPFTGLWKSDYGNLRLWQDGEEVNGLYPWAGSTARIRGVVDKAQRLKFRYEEPGGVMGEGILILDSGQDTFSGSWSSEAGQAGTWSGTRVVPRENTKWLVVLEAHWEQALAAPEFSYGEMLRSFFRRVPSVEVRHRFVHDIADLHRWCREVPFLAEPVVLYISSHGTEEGLSIGRDVVDAKALAEGLEGCINVKLLHLGSCLVGGGGLPEQLLRELAGSGHYPISGYAESADWAGSAVVDFAYLDLILSRGLAPKDAVDQVRKMITFAGQEPVPDTAILPADLRLIEPPKPQVEEGE